MPTDLLMIRHGQSVWNAERRWQGQADPPLSELGELQARTGAERLTASFDAVIASDLERASRTAELLTGRNPELNPAFRERHAGAWQGLTRDEIDAQAPDWQTTGWRPEGFEADDDLIERVLPAMNALASRADDHTTQTLLVATHGGVIRSLDRHLGAPDDAIGNLSGRWYHFDEGGWAAGIHVELASDVTLTELE